MHAPVIGQHGRRHKLAPIRRSGAACEEGTAGGTLRTGTKISHLGHEAAFHFTSIHRREQPRSHSVATRCQGLHGRAALTTARLLTTV